MSSNIEDLLSSLEREPVKPAPHSLIMRRARRRTLRRRAAAVAAAVAVVVGIGVVVSERVESPAELAAIDSDGDEPSSMSTTTPATSVVPTTGSTSVASTTSPATPTTSTTSTTAAAPNDAGELLWGKSFDAVAASDTGAPHELAPDSYVGFWRSTDHGNAYWSGGCNRLGAAVAVSSDRLDVAGEIQGTSMGCADELNGKDRWMTDLLTSDPTWVLDGDRLTIANDHATLELVLSPTPR